VGRLFDGFFTPKKKKTRALSPCMALPFTLKRILMQNFGNFGDFGILAFHHAKI